MNPADIMATTAEPERLKADPWKIRLWRTVQDWTQADLAAALGLWADARTHVCRIEGYGYVVGPRKLVKFAEALGVALEALQSTSSEYDENRLEYLAWVDAGRPPLWAWVRERTLAAGGAR